MKEALLDAAQWAGQRCDGGRGAEEVSPRQMFISPESDRDNYHQSQAASSLILPPQASPSAPTLQPSVNCHLLHVNMLICHYANERVSAFDLQQRPTFQQSELKCQQIHLHGDGSGAELWGEETTALHYFMLHQSLIQRFHSILRLLIRYYYKTFRNILINVFKGQLKGVFFYLKTQL